MSIRQALGLTRLQARGGTPLLVRDLAEVKVGGVPRPGVVLPALHASLFGREVAKAAAAEPSLA